MGQVGQIGATTHTQNTGGNTGRSTCTTGATETGTGKTEKIIPGIPAGLSQKEPKPVTITLPGGETVKPKKSKKTKKNEPDPETKDLTMNLTVMVKSVFDLIAARGGQLWEVSPEEAAGIAGPAARILARMEKAAAVNENADYVMLLVGAAVILVPRFLMMQDTKRRKEGAASGTEGEAAGDSQRVNGERPVYDGGNVKKLLPGLA